MTIKNAHWLFLEKFNKLESNLYRELTPVQIDTYLNNAQNLYVSSIINNSVEDTTRISKALAQLLVKSPTSIQAAITPTVVGTTYEMKSSQLAFECIYPVSFEILAAKTGCTAKVISVFIKEHDDRAYESSATRKSSWRWNRCRAYLGRSSTTLTSAQFNNFSLFMETDGDYTITSVYPTYYKAPRLVCLGGYTDIDDGSTKTVANFEFADNDIYLIIDLAIGLANETLEKPVKQQT